VPRRYLRRERPLFALHALRITLKWRMALHRDIYWLGRQWAVTGYGIQAVDQKRYGEHDVELARIHQDDLAATLRGFNWFDAEDFEEALRRARQRAQEALVLFRPLSGGEK